MHVHSPFLYVKTLTALLVLMALTIVVAGIHMPDINLGMVYVHGTILNNVIALIIAIIKASLVLAFFMGIKYATKLTKLWAGAGFVGFVLLFLALGDYSTRRYEPTPRWSGDPGSAMMRSVHESRTDKQFRDIEPGGRGKF